tara:strand:- start:274 stop:408 length:135 start_codon:yes stop_codon:yes gene_type:complete
MAEMVKMEIASLVALVFSCMMGATVAAVVQVEISTSVLIVLAIS